MESNSLKCSSTQMLHSIELKFVMYTIGHLSTYCVEFGEFKINSFFTGVQKRILKYYGLWNQILKWVIVSKRCIRLSSNSVCIL